MTRSAADTGGGRAQRKACLSATEASGGYARTWHKRAHASSRDHSMCHTPRAAAAPKQRAQNAAQQWTASADEPRRDRQYDRTTYGEDHTSFLLTQQPGTAHSSPMGHAVYTVEGWYGGVLRRWQSSGDGGPCRASRWVYARDTAIGVSTHQHTAESVGRECERHGCDERSEGGCRVRAKYSALQRSQPIELMLCGQKARNIGRILVPVST